MKTHLSNCQSLPRSIGSLPPVSADVENIPQPNISSFTGPHSTNAANQTVSNTTASGTLTHLRTDHLTPHARQVIDELFARAMHQTGTPFDFFEHPAWHEFLGKMRPAWKPPSAGKISNELLQKEYFAIMGQTIERIKMDKGGVFGMDGATNVLSKSLSNVIVHTPLPLFIEYLRSDRKRETTQNLLLKVQDCLNRLYDKVGFRCCFAFVSDSCNGMRDLRKEALAKGLFQWAYGCSTHCLHNLCEDLGEGGDVARIVKQSLYISKTIKNTGLVRKMFESICLEKFHKVYTMVMYSKSRWSTVNLMFRRLRLVKAAITYLPYALLHERESRGIDLSFHLPDEFSTTITDPSFWSNVDYCFELLNPVCKYIGILESDTSTMSLVYACLLFVRVHFMNCVATNATMKNYQDARLIARWNRIYSPVHALAFFCDPMFMEMRTRIQGIHGAQFIELGKGNMLQQCHTALDMLSENSTHNSSLMEEFMNYCIAPHRLLKQLKL